MTHDSAVALLEELLLADLLPEEFEDQANQAIKDAKKPPKATKWWARCSTCADAIAPARQHDGINIYAATKPTRVICAKHHREMAVQGA